MGKVKKTSDFIQNILFQGEAPPGQPQEQKAAPAKEAQEERRGASPREETAAAAYLFVFILTAGAMELCWLLALAAWCAAAAGWPAFPFLQATGTFWLAAAVASATRRGLQRPFYILLAHLFALSASALLLLYVFYGYRGKISFWDRSWLADIFAGPKGAMEIFVLIAVVLFAAIFYGGGLSLARRPKDYSCVTRRLDVGIGIFLLLLFADAGVKAPGFNAWAFLFPFFFFSMLAAALARCRGSGQKDYLPGQRWAGLVLTFSAAVLLFAVGAILVFLPYLTAAAEGGLALLKTFSNPLFYSFLLPILRFLFGRRSGGDVYEGGDPSVGGGSAMLPDAPAESSWGELAVKIFGFGILGVAAFALLLAAGWGLHRLFRWLLSENPERKEKSLLWERLFLWFALFIFRCRKLFSALLRPGSSSAAECSEAVRGYRRLLRWGRSCGLPRLLSETPREYGLRLALYFPAIKDEIELITISFNREIYGGLPVEEKQVALLKQARLKLYSPLIWFSRLKPRKTPK